MKKRKKKGESIMEMLGVPESKRMAGLEPMTAYQQGYLDLMEQQYEAARKPAYEEAEKRIKEALRIDWLEKKVDWLLERFMGKKGIGRAKR